MKKIVLSLFLVSALFINVNLVDARVTVDLDNKICNSDGFCIINADDTSNGSNQSNKNEIDIESECHTKCAGDNYSNCDTICDRVYYCFDACDDSNTDEYCQSHCYSLHYYEEVLNNNNNNSNNDDANNDEPLTNTYKKVQCGDTQIPKLAATLVRTVYIILQIAVPVIIIILGSLDLLKATIAQKEDEMKKGQQIFVRRLILGAIVFIVFALVQLVIGVVAPQNDNEGMWSCVDCLINGDCK